MPEPISVYKICTRTAWLAALESGELAPSADDERDGYIHLSSAAQLRGTLERHFATQQDLVLLELAVERLPGGALVWEPSRGGALFPHLYGPLRREAVARCTPLPDGASARIGALERALADAEHVPTRLGARPPRD